MGKLALLAWSRSDQEAAHMVWLKGHLEIVIFQNTSVYFGTDLT